MNSALATEKIIIDLSKLHCYREQETISCLVFVSCLRRIKTITVRVLIVHSGIPGMYSSFCLCLPSADVFSLTLHSFFSESSPGVVL